MLISVVASLKWYSLLVKRVHDAEAQLAFANEAKDNLRLGYISVEELLSKATNAPSSSSELKENAEVKEYLSKYSSMSIGELRAETELFVGASQSSTEAARAGYLRDRWVALLCPIIFGLIIILIS